MADLSSYMLHRMLRQQSHYLQPAGLAGTAGRPPLTASMRVAEAGAAEVGRSSNILPLLIRRALPVEQEVLLELVAVQRRSLEVLEVQVLRRE